MSGRVQGVGFRWFVTRRASALDLRGWARNLPDGRVEVVATGAPASLSALDQAVRSGPMLARVESVEKSNIPHETVDAKSFEAR